MIKVYLDVEGQLVKVDDQGRTTPCSCPFYGGACHRRCPHLDDSYAGYVRLSCGGTLAVLEQVPAPDAAKE